MADEINGMDILHGVLDLAGFAPGPFGPIADGINAVIYLAEGDIGNAVLSGMAAIPIYGDIGSAVGKTAKAVDNLTDTTKMLEKADNVADATKMLEKADNVADATKMLEKADGPGTGLRKIFDAAKGGKAIIGAIGNRIHKFLEDLLESIKKMFDERCLNGACFTGDTLVLTSQGYRPIKEIRKDDDICSRNVQTGETGFRKVAEIFQSEAHTIHHIWLDGTEELEVTAYHPLYVEEKGWVSAINLREGDLIVTMEGTAQVTKVDKMRHEEPVPVYNFHVEEWESYFVSKKQVYAHNTDCAATRPVTVSQEKLQHAVLGDFKCNGRLNGGGHGQANIEHLNEHNIEYNIVRQFDNGVRVGNVPNHIKSYKRQGTVQSWFPEEWTELEIKNAGEHVANLPENVNIQDGKINGEYKGVRVVVFKNNGEIGTIFPDNASQPGKICKGE